MSSRLTPAIEEAVLEPTPRAIIDRLLFAEGGAFDPYPGPVALVGRGGILISGNGAGQLLAKRLADGSVPALGQAVESALAGKPARLLPLLLADESKTLALDVAVMPWQPGDAVLLLARDITLERSLRAALVESRQRYKDLVEAASDFAWETDSEGCFTFLSAPSALGFVANELIGRSVSELLAVPDSGADAPFRARAELRGTLVWLRDAQDASRCLAVDARPLYDADGIWCGARGLCRDTTEAASREGALAEARHRERLLGYLLNLLRQEIDPKRRLESAVAALLRALPASGVVIYRRADDSKEMRWQVAFGAGSPPPEQAIERLLRQLGDGPSRVEANEDGNRLVVLTACHQDEANGALALWRAAQAAPWQDADRFLIDEIANEVGATNRQSADQQALKDLSNRDGLTGLLNSRGFRAGLVQRLGESGDVIRPAALIYIDLDNFKLVNDRFGHRKGDEALLAVAKLLRGQVRDRDLAARLGGDEFALFLDGIDARAAQRRAAALVGAAGTLAAMSGDPERPLSLSIGVALLAPNMKENLDQLLARADRAMYRVKRRGKAGVEIVGPGKAEAN